MIRKVTLAVIAGIALGAPGPMFAQVGGGGPEMGSGDASKSSAASRDQQAGYNRVIGGIVPLETKVGRKGKAVPAEATDIKVGSGLRDITGAPIGRVVFLASDGAVVDTGKTKIKVPTTAIGKDDNGLLLGITAARFGELVSKATRSN